VLTFESFVVNKMIMKRQILSLSFWTVAALAFCQTGNISPYLKIPLIDLGKETFRQVTVDREDGQYLGHPTTVLLEDGKTILTVYPKGHGKGEIVFRRSTDGGLTWSERLPVPGSWKTSKEVPTIFRVEDKNGRKRLIMFSGLYPARMAVSEDDGKSWGELKSIGDWGGIVVMASLIPLKTGRGHYMAMFHDDLRYFTADGQNRFNEDKKKFDRRLFTLYKTFSYDGGLTWSYPEVVLSGRDMNLCEPGAVRSPDGKQIAVLLRENSRRFNSQIIFSNDEGKTFNDPGPLPNSLNGDRHVLRYGPDGRLLVVFRDVSPLSYRNDLEKISGEKKEHNVSILTDENGLGSPTEGDWAGWVGTYKDLQNGNNGQYRIRFMDNMDSWDCCYPGVELLPDGTFVVTTYGHWEKDKEPFIVSVRVKLNELDMKLKTRMVVGCFSDTGENGLNICDFNSSDGTLNSIKSINAGPNPSYFCISKSSGLIYAINEVAEFMGKKGGGLTTIKYNGNFENPVKVGEMSVPNGGPCYISITPDNNFLLVANYAGGSVSVVRLDKNGVPEKVCDTIIYNGTGGKVSHAHMIKSDPAGNRIYVTDLGLDRIMIYSLDKFSGKLTPFIANGISLPEGTGPRHFTFSNDGSLLYVMGELNSTVSVFRVDKINGLIPVQTISSLDQSYKDRNSAADIHLGYSGEFLYGTNRGENSIVTFKIQPDGRLLAAGHTSCGGNWPRNFVIDPAGKFILVGNQKSGDISVFRINDETGIPSELSHFKGFPAPACLKF
jgi:6-phosphogluconolactonase (cycloisomerase 2 family)